MKILSINSVNYGSTGGLMDGINKKAEEKGFSVLSASAKSRQNLKNNNEKNIFIGSIFSRNLSLKLSQFTGLNGCFLRFSTYRFLKKAEKFSPDILHLHNLHNNYINLPMLFRWIKKRKIRVIWTLHDCWAFTGQCPHFTLAKCNKWKNGCSSCPQYKEYPKAYVDKTKKMWKLKKKWFCGIENMTIVTPSEWLAKIVKQSFLSDYEVKVINNGIDLSVFRPSENFDYEKYEIKKDKKIILGVSFGWTRRKGLDVFIELSKRLDEEKYQIVLVGTNDKTDELLPDNIISIHQTNNKEELAQIYSLADVFVNPTREEVFGLVNAEAIACGTPVITFNTGGSPEIIDEASGSVIDCDDIKALEEEIIRVCNQKPYSAENCIKRAKTLDKNEKFMEYIKLYSI